MERARPGVREGLAALVLYAALSVALTWPLARDPARLGTPNMDAYGNAWAIAWVARQLGRDPAQLFDANMFHPWSGSLAYAESLIPQSLAAWPVLALGGSPLLAYNLVLLASFAGSGLGAHLLARELGAGRAAACLAGVAFAFWAGRFDHLVHLQTLTTPFLPLALLYALRAMREGGRRNLAGLGLSASLQALASGYFALLTALALGLLLALEWWRLRAHRRLAAALGALALGALPLLWVFLQYRVVHERHGFSRGRAESIQWSARPSSYLDPGGSAGALPHVRWLQRVAASGEPLSPGLVVVGLGLLGLARRRRTQEGQLLGGLVLLGFLLSLGPEIRVAGLTLPGPFELLRLLPGGRLLRTPSRLGVLAVLALATLAALELARLAARRRWLAPLAVALACLELRPVRIGIGEMPAPPPTVGFLAEAPRGPVLELPWNAPGDSALYLYWSTGHWQPMVNGFGSFDPPGHAGIGLLGNRWPTEYSAGEFRRLGVRWVVAHVERLRPAHRERLLAAVELPAGVRLVFEAGPHRVYEIGPEAP